ncbi:MAG TPA: hypothetical protein VKE96_25845 [Vicinamibacterales bacterium]|nr:hypothetical protein [Vicinamibacterales bacterium]
MKKSSKDESGNVADGAMRDQEVLRANGELAAYFKGLRTEREARAALKIIKAFIKRRERSDAARRRPLPGLEPSPAPKHAAMRTRKKAAKDPDLAARRHRKERARKSDIEVERPPDTNAEPPVPADSTEHE